MIYAGFAFFVARFAQYAFSRSFLTWFCLSLIFTPVASFVFLLVAGIPFDKIIKNEIKQKALRKYGEEINLETAAECPNCKEIYDISTGFGIMQDETQSWKIYCENCKQEIKVKSTLKKFPNTGKFSKIMSEKGCKTMTDEYQISPEEMESAHFFSLVLSLSQSVMYAMGKSPNPMTGKVERDLIQAQQTIDLIAMLKNKTKGNLNDKEKVLIDNTLTSLRFTCAKELEQEAKRTAASRKEAQKPGPEKQESVKEPPKPDPEKQEKTVEEPKSDKE
ncbi:MAG: hypothetical protein A2161_22695 [Candidatus Schekmanbacteria bacterium RBG_13_48_7]|uniref:DUF1844 domain-containing protein n=1 Tax=Candidatus Schekmanbacteria bacterium RBG_13_48_7 TaxID=1817878 RepID=A0A1F7S250_9BACT|nr:MAG: hypothetical protein A2161_22695 [Candidatus Schekmanbacteria bacterium RBG_13_48_7]